MASSGVSWQRSWDRVARQRCAAQMSGEQRRRLRWQHVKTECESGESHEESCGSAASHGRPPAPCHQLSPSFARTTLCPAHLYSLPPFGPLAWHTAPAPSLSTRSAHRSHPEVVIAPPALYLQEVLRTVNKPVQVAAQNAYHKASGAFTGEISPQQLKDAGIPWVILGHSERRSLFGDTEELVAQKVKAALDAGVKVIACIGETLEQREQGVTNDVCCGQLGAIAGALKEDEWA